MKLLVALFVLALCTASFAQDMSDFGSLQQSTEAPSTNTPVGDTPSQSTEAPITNTPVGDTVENPPTTDIPPTTVTVPPSSASSPSNANQGASAGTTRPARTGYYANRNQRSRYQSGSVGNFIRDDLNARPGTLYGAVRQAATQIGLGQLSNSIPTVGGLLGVSDSQGRTGAQGSGSGNRVSNFVRDDLNARPGTLYGAVRQAATQVGLGQLSNGIPTVGGLLGVSDSQGRTGGAPGGDSDRVGSQGSGSPGRVSNFIRDDLNARPGTLYGAVRQAATQIGLGQLSNSIPTVGGLLGVSDSQGRTGGAPGSGSDRTGSQGNYRGGVSNFIRNDLNARPGTLYGAVRQAATQVGLGQLSNSIPTVGALLGLNAVGDQNAEFAPSNDNNSSEMPAWAVALIVLGVLVLLGTIAVSVQFALMLRRI